MNDKVDLTKVSNEELQKEIRRRFRPQIKDVLHFSSLKETLEYGINEIARTGHSKSFEHYVYEETMKCFYGPDVFDWLNKHRED